MELKNLSFSLEEIKRIILLSDEDKSGELRREILLSSYREKLIDAEKKVKALNDHIGELKWHIKQLESASDSFQECPGSLCTNCSFKRNCSFSSKK